MKIYYKEITHCHECPCFYSEIMYAWCLNYKNGDPDGRALYFGGDYEGLTEITPPDWCKLPDENCLTKQN